MEPEKRKELDRELRKARTKIALKVAGAAMPFVLLILWYVPYFTVGNEIGTAVSLTSQQSDEGTYMLMVVVLENGEKVTATMGRRMSYHPGATVVLRKKRNVFGFAHYSFLRYENG